MVYKVIYNQKKYIKDYKNYLLHFRKKTVTITLLICIALVIFYQSVKLFSGNDLAMTFLFSAGIGSFFFLLIEINIILSNLYKINKTSKRFNERVENIIFEPTVIKFSEGTNSFPVFKSQIKECLIIKQTLFIIMKKKNVWPMRINKSEVGKREFELILSEFQKNKIDIIYV